MTQFESLPNELIYLIFKYLNANDIFNGLPSLNWRFTALLSAYIEYKVDFRSVSKNIYDSICSKTVPSHVQTLHLSNKRYTCGQIQNFLNRFPLNSFSCRLRSLSLKQGCHLMKSRKRKTLLKIRKKAEREIEKADKKTEIDILTRFYDF
jgi:hypothetical protein